MKPSATVATRALILAALGTVSMATFAHTGEAGHSHAGFVEGLLHPFTGLDHLAAMLAVGLWSALTLRQAWAAPLAFVLLLAAGALAGFAGLAVPGVEPLIAASVLVLGLLVAGRRGLPVLAACAVAGGFAFFHGVAHGAELASANPWAALAGMVLGTAVLHAAGLALGHASFARQRGFALAAGGAFTALGLGLIAALA